MLACLVSPSAPPLIVIGVTKGELNQLRYEYIRAREIYDHWLNHTICVRFDSTVYYPLTIYLSSLAPMHAAKVDLYSLHG